MCGSPAGGRKRRARGDRLMERRSAELRDGGAAPIARELVERVRVTGLDGARIGRTPTGLSARMREQLGLPLDRPVIMSGHQAELWHPGILAKWIAGVEIARRVGGVFAWLHVDQDTNEPGAIDVPVIDGAGVLVKRTLTLVDPARDVPTGVAPGSADRWRPRATGAGRVARGCGGCGAHRRGPQRARDRADAGTAVRSHD
jgi:hypothetical protein